MKPVMQKVFDPKKGDCFRACIASIFEFPIDKIPNFWEQTQKPSEFWKLYDKWLEEKFRVRTVSLEYSKGLTDDLRRILCVAIGDSPRGVNRGHAVVWKGKIIHDPFPDGKGLKGNPECLILFVPYDPGEIAKQRR